MSGTGEQHGDLTVLIEASRDGDRAATDRLFELVYNELRDVARRMRRVGGFGETMQPTALANETYLLFNRRFPISPLETASNRAVFFRTVALAMRALLRDYWRGKNAKKRGGGAGQIALDEHDPPDMSALQGVENVDFLALDEALDRLEQYNRRWWDVVMQRHFAGRSIEETAEILDLDPTTVKADWIAARAWLKREMEK